MVRDRVRLARRLERARSAEDVASLERAVEEAERRIERRRQAVPELRYPAGLPIVERRDELLDVLGRAQVVIVAGETGSGKSTQLPKLCLELGRGVAGLIGHTQPRRLAARAVAERVADELGTEVGDAVGYAVRFTDRVGEHTLVKVMTDGILLAEIQRDRLLSQYDTLIIDEAHERSLNIDFLLGYVKGLLPRRPDLKVIVTSATIDTQRFSEHFDGAPIVEVSGRSYPVEVRYRPVDEVGSGGLGGAGGEDSDDGGRDQVQAICDAVDELCDEGPGDVLVFLSGEREIRDTAEALRRTDGDLEVLPLYARLSSAEQHRVFQPHRGRRVVLATNVAETSLTVPGIRYVVDPGTARISRYSRRTKVQRLPIEPVSRASADQRAGRCGRVAPGVCIRLYAEEDFAARRPFTEPEILRTNLASVILQMTALGLGDIAAFPFVEAPDRRSITDGIALLEELAALEPAAADQPRRLTPLGRRLARLPLDPRLGRMVLEAHQQGCLAEVMTIVAGLSIQDPRERPSGREQAAAELHGRFATEGSDFLAWLRLWEYVRERQHELSSSQFRRLCRQEHLNHQRIREWQDVRSQLRQVTQELGLHPDTSPAEPDAIHRALLAGMLSHVGLRVEEPRSREYRGARTTKFAIARGSVLADKSPRWVMAAELVETNRLWARVVARIQPEWAERLAPHLVRRSYAEPRWEARRGAATVEERVTLYGLPIVAGRAVPWSRIDPAAARHAFIGHALVDGDWAASHPFLEANRKVLEEVRALAERARRRDILVADDALFAFYDDRVAGDVTSGHAFDRWWSRARRAQPELLTCTAEALLGAGGPDLDSERHPEVWHQGDLALDLSYEYEPGATDDGVTVHVPLAALDKVSPEGFDWQVPVLREELVVALVRSLPKALRRHFVPVPDTVRTVLDQVGPSDGPLVPVVARVLSRLAGVAVRPDDFDLGHLPDHLRPTFRVVDDDGAVLGAGKDLDELKESLRPRLRESVVAVAHLAERTGQRAWTFGTVPKVTTARLSGHDVEVFPALVDEGDSVGLRLFTSPAEQAGAMEPATRRLLLSSVPSAATTLRRRLDNATSLALAHSPSPTVAALLEDCVTAAVQELLDRHGGPAWDEEGFERLRQAVRAGVDDRALAVVRVVAGILTSARAVEQRLGALAAPALAPAVADMRAHLARLVYPGFVAATGAPRLADVRRYVQGIERRAAKVTSNVQRDTELMKRARELEACGGMDDEVRWMIEELRVSYFAQALGTRGQISEQRIRRRLAG